MSPCLGRRCEACAYPKVGVFLVRHQLLIGPSAKLCNGGGVSIPPDVPPLGHACLARSRVPHHLAWVPDVSAPVGCPQGPWHLRLHRGIQAGDKQGASTCPRDGDRVAKTLPADHRVPRFPPLPLPTHLPSPPCTCLCLGAGRQGGHPGAGAGGRRWRGGDTGWSESKPGICRMSPYPDSLCFPVSISTVLLQPPAGGVAGSAFGEEESSPLACRSLAAHSPQPPFPLPCSPLGCEAPGYKSWRRRAPILLQPPGMRLGDGGAVTPALAACATPNCIIWLRRASVSPRRSGEAGDQQTPTWAAGPPRPPAPPLPAEPRRSCGAGGMLGLAPPQTQRRGPLLTALHISPDCPSSL